MQRGLRSQIERKPDADSVSASCPSLSCIWTFAHPRARPHEAPCPWTSPCPCHGPSLAPWRSPSCPVGLRAHLEAALSARMGQAPRTKERRLVQSWLPSCKRARGRGAPTRRGCPRCVRIALDARVPWTRGSRPRCHGALDARALEAKVPKEAGAFKGIN